MSDSLVSVLMPTYNQDRFIGCAINSVLAQSFADFELIISDNASTDTTRQIVESFLNQNTRIRYYLNDSNIGAHANFNLTLKRAGASKYFIVLSSDDWWEPDLLEHLVDLAERNPEVTLVHSDTYRVDENGTVINRYSDLWSSMPRAGRHRGIKELFLSGCYFNVNATLVNRAHQFALYPSDQLFDPTLKYTADYHLWLQLMIRGAAAYYVPQPLAFYRKHDAAYTTAKNTIARMEEQVTIFRDKLADACPPELEHLRLEALLLNLKQLGFAMLVAGRKAEALSVLTEAERLSHGQHLDIRVAVQMAAAPLPPSSAAFAWRTMAFIAGKVR